MKKLMVMVVMMGLGLVAIADASYSWTLTKANAYNGYSVYLLASSLEAYDEVHVYKDVADGLYDYMLIDDSNLASAEVETWEAYYSILNESIPADGVINSGTMTASCDSLLRTISVLLIKDGFAPGNEYVILDAISRVSEANGNAVYDLSGATIMTTTDARQLKGVLRTDTVPEPTSGLMMLLGFAGLALKRKRA